MVCRFGELKSAAENTEAVTKMMENLATQRVLWLLCRQNSIHNIQSKITLSKGRLTLREHHVYKHFFIWVHKRVCVSLINLAVREVCALLNPSVLSAKYLALSRKEKRHSNANFLASEHALPTVMSNSYFTVRVWKFHTLFKPSSVQIFRELNLLK